MATEKVSFSLKSRMVSTLYFALAIPFEVQDNDGEIDLTEAEVVRLDNLTFDLGALARLYGGRTVTVDSEGKVDDDGH